MSLKRLIAIVCIYLLACAGWAVLGTTTMLRSEGSARDLDRDVAALWGGPLSQSAPDVRRLDDADAPHDVLLGESRVEVGLELEHRRKGLVWYPTYTCAFSGRYRLDHPGTEPGRYRFEIALPDASATYHDFALLIDGSTATPPGDPRDGISHILTIPGGEAATIELRYRTRGLRTWRYLLGGDQGRVRAFSCTVITNFDDYDFADGSISADRVEERQEGVELRWATDEMITSQAIGIVAPDRLNPGPLSSRITFFAPICLGFFFLLLGATSVVRGIDTHPMHYLFVAGGFVAFHVLFAYLVDHVDGVGLHLAFFGSAATSIALVTTYLRTALGPRLSIVGIALGQLCFLVLFSYSFFLEGSTGLTVAIGSVIFLAFLMRITARVDWAGFFGRDEPDTAGAR